MKGYTRGESIDGNDIWYVTAKSGLYTRSGGYTSQSTDGLTEIKSTDTTPAEPVKDQPSVNEPWTPRDPEIVDVTADDFPAWINFEQVEDRDDTDSVNKEAYDYYKQKYGQDYQYYPIESGVHWWGSPTAGYTHDGVKNRMLDTDGLGVDFITSANRITKFGSLGMKRVSYTTGPRSMYQWTSENDPKLTEDGYKTLGLLHYVVEKKNPRLKGEQIRLHKEFMATECSNIHVKKVRAYADKFATGELDFATGKPKQTQPVPIDTPETDTSDPAIVTPTPEPEKPAVVTEIKTVIINALVTFVQAFGASWVITGYALDRLTLIGLVGSAASVVWNTILKPYLIKAGWLKQ